jgi:hypothetical protein
MEKPKQIVPEKCIGYEMSRTTVSYKASDTILYALGVGASADPMNTEDLNFTFELAENFKVLPTFAVVMGSFNDIFAGLERCPGIPAFNLMMLLHGEEEC